MNVTIVGAGNIGLQFASHCAQANNVTVFTRKKISSDIEIVDENNDIVLIGHGVHSSDNPDCCFKDADLVFVTYPAFMMKSISETIFPYARSGMTICLVPGTGGGEYPFRKYISKGVTVFGIQRVPSVARVVEEGKKVKCVGYRSVMHVSSMPNERASYCVKIIEDIFGIETQVLPNYLNIALTPSNPLLHTSRLYNLFRNYDSKAHYANIPLFYEDWNDETSELLLAMDDELQQICKKIPLDLSCVKSLKEHYESNDYKALTKKITSIKGFKNILTPMAHDEDGYIPDLNSRYFTADFNYGLSIISQVAGLTDTPHPNIDMVFNWYERLKTKSDMFDLKEYGIRDLSDLVGFYSI